VNRSVRGEATAEILIAIKSSILSEMPRKKKGKFSLEFLSSLSP
jgi:hypothetical protein